MTAIVAGHRPRLLHVARPDVVVAVCIVAVAVCWQLTHDVNADVSWLLDLGERTLDGARFYVDFFEVNPPASVLLYLPAIVAARMVGVSSELMTMLFVVAGCGASLGLCARILACAPSDPPDRRILLPLALIVLLVAPMNTFAQREHIAVLACLPFLASLSVRADGARMPRRLAVLAGLGAGIAVAIKPMFALGLIGPLAYLIYARRSWRIALMLPEGWIGALLAGGYALGVIAFVPVFADRVLPVALQVYFPARLPLVQMVRLVGVMIWALLTLGFLRTLTDRKPPALAIVLALSSCGFLLNFFWQGKGFNYHTYPAVALMVLAFGITSASFPKAIWRVVLNGAVLGLSLGFACKYFAWSYDTETWAPGLAQAMVAIKPKPTMIAFTPEIAVGHPFARRLGGRWVGSLPSTWISGMAGELSAGSDRPDRFARFVTMEQTLYADDIRREQPDFVLVDGPEGSALIASFAPLRAALDDYQIKGTYGPLTLWARKPL